MILEAVISLFLVVGALNCAHRHDWPCSPAGHLYPLTWSSQGQHTWRGSDFIWLVLVFHLLYRRREYARSVNHRFLVCDCAGQRKHDRQKLHCTDE